MSPPFRIADGLYYVGGREIASYLIETTDGSILINSGLRLSVRLIEANLRELQLRFKEIKVLLISHAHVDHCAGSAKVKELFRDVQYKVMKGDVDVVESGGRTDFAFGSCPPFHFPPVRVDEVLEDGSEVTLGGVVLTAHRTPGHTRGCTTWTMRVQDGNASYDTVIVGSASVIPGYRLVGNEAYPEIADDYARTFQVLRSLPCEIFLSAHGRSFDLWKKYHRMMGNEPAPFVDPEGYRAHVDRMEAAFRRKLERQQRGLVPPTCRWLRPNS